MEIVYVDIWLTDTGVKEVAKGQTCSAWHVVLTPSDTDMSSSGYMRLREKLSVILPTRDDTIPVALAKLEEQEQKLVEAHATASAKLAQEKQSILSLEYNPVESDDDIPF